MYSVHLQSWDSILNNLLFPDERDGISTSLENSQKMVQACNTELNNLKGQLAAACQQINALKESKEEVGKLMCWNEILLIPHSECVYPGAYYSVYGNLLNF